MARLAALALAVLAASGAAAAPAARPAAGVPASAARIAGCWDNEGKGPAHKALCFGDNGSVRQLEDGSFGTGNVAWMGSYGIPADGSSVEIRVSGRAAQVNRCRLSYRTERLRYFDKVAGSRIMKDWPQVRLDGCDLSGTWMKSCDKFQVSYGTCPRSDDK